jgi:hypothetical protein
MKKKYKKMIKKKFLLYFLFKILCFEIAVKQLYLDYNLRLMKIWVVCSMYIHKTCIKPNHTTTLKNGV